MYILKFQNDNFNYLCSSHTLPRTLDALCMNGKTRYFNLNDSINNLENYSTTLSIITFCLFFILSADLSSSIEIEFQRLKINERFPLPSDIRDVNSSKVDSVSIQPHINFHARSDASV